MPIILMKYPTVSGTSKLSGFSDYIPCEDFAVEGKESLIGAVQVQGREPASQSSKKRAFNAEAIEFSRKIDAASPGLLAAAFSAMAKTYPDAVTVTIKVLLTALSGDTGMTFVPGVTLVMNKTWISNYTQKIDDKSMTENITFSFDSMDVTFEQYVDGTRKGQVLATVTMGAIAPSSSSA